MHGLLVSQPIMGQIQTPALCSFQNGIIQLRLTQWIQTHERFKIRLFSRTKHNMRIWILFGSCLISSSHSCFTFLFDWAAKPGPVDLPETFPQSSFPFVLDLLFNETTFNEEVTKFVNTQTSVLNGTDKILISR